MKTMNRIMGIMSLVFGALCIIPSIIGGVAGILLMSEEDIVGRIIATILFEVFLFAGGAISTIIPTEPIATIISSVMLSTAGALQIIYNAEFSLVFVGSISLLILSWVAVISILFGLFILLFSINKIVKLKKSKDTVIVQDGEFKSEDGAGRFEYHNVEKCINCEANIPQNARFCPNCGYEIPLINDTATTEINPVVKKKRGNKTLILIVCIALLVSVVGIFVSFINSNNSILPSNANEDELKLVNYIIENGNYNEEDKAYSVSESTNEAGIDFHYSIIYNTETKNLTFRDTSSISSGLTITTMNYEYGAEEQSVSINMAISGGYGVSSKGIIYPATYTSSNKTIHSFESSYSDTRTKSICETSVYQMLTHCQLIMIDADTGMVPFGFEKGLFK